MSSHHQVTDETIERLLSVVLRTGVLIAGSVVLVGGIYFVFRHAGEPADYHTFRGEPSVDRLLHEIVAAAFRLRARSIIQLGVLLLIATPIIRVIFSLIGFAMERDRAYVVITAIVLSILLYSLISGVTGA
ncbi:MAG TPA: DUF1634 domain-containing protein [Bryobacteraceae bacterium]|nr:DUF1634 domain-containing protein [Bryobacteraceae bacterium]